MRICDSANVQMFESANAVWFECTDMRMCIYAKLRAYECVNVRMCVYVMVGLFKSVNVRMYESWNMRICEYANM